jgi:hypothetical protein
MNKDIEAEVEGSHRRVASTAVRNWKRILCTGEMELSLPKLTVRSSRDLVPLKSCQTGPLALRGARDSLPGNRAVLNPHKAANNRTLDSDPNANNHKPTLQSGHRTDGRRNRNLSTYLRRHQIPFPLSVTLPPVWIQTPTSTLQCPRGLSLETPSTDQPARAPGIPHPHGLQNNGHYHHTGRSCLIVPPNGRLHLPPSTQRCLRLRPL